MDNQARIIELEEENAKLKEELLATKEHLKKYTAPASRKIYYENNKEAIKERIYNNRPTPEIKKEYNKKAYLRRKEKLQKEMEENQHSKKLV